MIRLLATAFLFISFLSCARMPDRGVEKKYQLHGVIVRLDAQAQTATIKHEAIVGWMEAMTMEFPVPSKEEFAKLARDQTIRATVFVRDFDFHIGEIVIESK
jgi:Cu/Ag efflux protein CusF